MQQNEEIYYINPVPSDPKCMYITSRIKNPEVERGHLQYQIIPELLINVIILDGDLLDFVIEEKTEENIKRLLPLTKTAGDINDYKLLLVIKLKRDNNLICLKGALLNKKTNRIALMTSFNSEKHITDNNSRAIKSHDPSYFIGHYRLSAPPKFWSELIKIVKQELPLKIKYKLRNNQWRKHTNVLDSIIYTKKIVSPYGHWKETNKLFNEGKFNNEKFAKIFINDININDYILMFDTNYDYALVLKITSKPIAERLNDIIIIRDNKCNHTPLVKDCKECIDSILEIFSSKYFEKNYKSYTKYLNEDYKFENMHAIIRNVEIVGKINNTCEAYNQKNYFQGSINRINIEIDRKDILKVNIDNEQLNIDNKKDYETDSDDDNNNIIL